MAANDDDRMVRIPLEVVPMYTAAQASALMTLLLDAHIFSRAETPAGRMAARSAGRSGSMNHSSSRPIARLMPPSLDRRE